MSLNQLGLCKLLDVNSLIKQRNKSYPMARQEFIDINVMNDIKTTGLELNMFRVMWLNKELKFIKSSLSDTYPNGDKKTQKNSKKYNDVFIKYEEAIKKEQDLLIKEINLTICL